jgi:alpha-tubulin suppressor-like RCC1 family protein
VALLGAILSSLAACGGDDPVAPLATTNPVRRIALSRTTDSLLIGDTVTLRARALDSSGVFVPGAEPTWRSLDAGVATVDASGGVHALSVGTARIVAGAMGAEDTATISVFAPLAFADIDIGGGTACGVTVGGDAYCWGAGQLGQLGAGAALPLGIQRAPVLVVGGHHFSTVSVGGEHACGLTTDGTALCWGGGRLGPLGTGTSDATSPTPVLGGLHFTAVWAGYDRTCGRTLSGEIYCWGSGVSASFDSPPTLMTGWPSFVSMDVHSSDHACGVDVQGAAWCWGSNSKGQLGVDGIASSATPVQVQGGLTFRSVTAGDASAFSCGIATDGTAWCWGVNDQFQLGTGSLSVASSATPLQVPGVIWSALNSGYNYTCGVDNSGFARCWGSRLLGTINGGAGPVPATLPSGEATAVAAGIRFACALVDGHAYCWGAEALGNGTDGGSALPVPVSFPRPLGG